jgi:hypothetical protein
MIRLSVKTRINPFVTKFIFVGVMVGIMAVMVGIFLPSRSPYTRSDLFAYKIATDVVVRGDNPYDPATIRTEWITRLNEWQATSSGYTQQTPLMVWNPPVFFLFPGSILRLPEAELYGLWPLVPCFSGALLALIGWMLAKGASGRIIPLTIAAFSSIPLLIEFQISQMSSFLAVPPLVGILFFLGRRDLLAGSLFSLAILKPHVVFFPLSAVAFWVLWERRWKVVVGGALGVLVGSIASELFFPGINTRWFHRASWPVDYAGSSLTLMLRAAAYDYGYPDPFFLMILVPALGVLVLWIYLACKAPQPSVEPIIWALVLNQLFAPYGFLMDQTVLIVVQAFMVSKISSRTASNCLLVALLLANMTVPVTLMVQSDSQQRLWWVSYPLTLIAILAVFTLRKTEIKYTQS